MANKEAKQKDGFGLPSTDVRKKDNALMEAARIADKMAKWYAEFGPFKDVPKIEEVVELYEDVAKEAELAAKKLAAEKAKEVEEKVKAKADKKAKLQAELDALDE